MKIAFLSHVDINLYLFRLAWMKALKEQCHKVYAIIPKGNYFEKFKDYGIFPIEYKSNRGTLNPLKDIMHCWQLYKILHKERFNVLHTFTFKPNVYGTIAGKIAGISIIINHVTGLGIVYTLKGFKIAILRMISNIFYFICFRFSDIIIFQNQDDYSALRFLIPKNKTILFIKGTGVDVEYFSPGNADIQQVAVLKKRFDIQSTDLVIAIIARLLWSKGIREFLQAAESLRIHYPNLKFLVVGWMDKENPDGIDENVIKENKNSRILFTGEVLEIRELLYLTDIYVLPSYREGIPRTILEAMAMHKPIVTTDVPGCRETVENGRNGFLVPLKNYTALTEKLKILIEDAHLRTKMGAESRKKAENEFSDEIVVNKIVGLYSQLFHNSNHVA